jgi:hypothetical protein
MTSGRIVLTALMLAGAGIVAGAPAPARAGVVVASSGPSAGQFPTGKKLADTDTVVLKGGDSITVLDAAGTRVLKGPGNFRVGAKGGDKRSTFAMLTRQRAAQRVRTGAVRGGGGEGPATNPSLWNVEVDKSGTICVTPGTTINLWRPSSAGEGSYTVQQPGSEQHVHVQFADGDSTAVWNPEELPLKEGSSYAISAPGGSASTVTFEFIDPATDDPEGLAQELAAKGCKVQLDQLANAMMTNS